MKKRVVKKLALSRETLRNLDESSLQVAGGAPAKPSLQYSDCDTCGIVCTVWTCNCPIE